MNDIFVKKPSLNIEAKDKELKQQKNKYFFTNKTENQDDLKLDQIEKELISLKGDEIKESKRNSV